MRRMISLRLRLSKSTDIMYNLLVTPVWPLLNLCSMILNIIPGFSNMLVYHRFVQQKLGGPSISDYEKLKAEKLDLQLKYNELLDTHKDTCRQVCHVTMLAMHTTVSVYRAYQFPMFGSIWCYNFHTFFLCKYRAPHKCYLLLTRVHCYFVKIMAFLK